MALKIMPHGGLQEWVAEEKGYFAAEGLDYSFVITRTTAFTVPRGMTPGRSRTGPSRVRGRARRCRRELRVPMGHVRGRERTAGQS